MSMQQFRSAHLFYGIVDQPTQPRNPNFLDGGSAFGTITPMRTTNRNTYARRWHILIFLLIAVIFGTVTAPAHARPLTQVEFHIVEAGDTWQSISARYLVPVTELWIANGVTNPSLLQPNQRLFIPDGSTQQQGQVINSDKPLAVVWAAYRHGVSIGTILALNGRDSYYATSGTLFAAPYTTLEVAEVTTMPGTAETAIPATAQPTALPGSQLRRSLMGIQGHFFLPEDERAFLLDEVAYTMRFGWIKMQVDWSSIEYGPDQYSAYLEELDKFVHGAFQRDLKILLSVVKAPDWARSSTAEDGPPDDYNTYYDFLRFLLSRYQNYSLNAIEVWNEPNLRREWNNGQSLSGAAYVELLAGAYQAIKETNGSVMVISAGLAPTGVNGDEARSDRLYFREMYEAGLANYADAIGIHPYGWANPPWTRCCTGSPALSHNDDPSFYFLDTVEDYREIQLEFNDGGRQFWATEFGWGTMDGLDLPVPAEQPFFAYLDQAQQAQYILEAYRLGQQWEFMGPMFLWNLNVAALYGDIDANQAGYSIFGRSYQQPREAYRVLVNTPKSDD
jgi:polysaccharide biosynthesis protein PslG